MSKYQPLSDRLAAHGADEWRTTFEEIEKLLGFPLPKTARAGKAWWSNASDKPHVRAWTAHGWEAHDLDQALGAITFRRTGGAAGGGDVLTSPAPQPEPAPEPSAEPAASQAPRKLGMAAAIGGAAAVVAGLGALAVRAFLKRR